MTIPFLGVRSTDGPALVAAAGKPLTIAAKDLDNPAFKAYASFSSGGPATATAASSRPFRHRA